MTATLLASLFTVIAAGTASAAITVSGVGTIAQGQTSSGTATFTFTENSIGALVPGCTGSITVTITPAGLLPTGTVTFEGLPSFTTSPPGSLGATVTGGGSTSSFTISVTGNDPLNIETLVVGGMKIKASTTASPGAIVASLSGTACVIAGFQAGTTTAHGKLAQAYGIGTTTWSVAVDADSACDFAGLNNVTVGGETRTPTAVTAKDLAGQQTFTTNAFALNHLANDVVTQTVPIGGPGTSCLATTIGSPGTVAAALTFPNPGQAIVFPGENNSPANSLSISENASTGAAYLVAGKTITVTITTDGVTFSSAPRATANNLGFLFTATPVPSNPAIGTLSADRKSATWTIDTANAALDTIAIDLIRYDVAATVPGGTSINVTVAYSGGLVQPASRSNAVVARPVTATATAPNVFIGENGQTGGTISIVENSAGTFTDGTGSFNTFEICLTTGENFASAPSATVTAGNLQLRSGLAPVAPGTAVVGTPFTSFSGNPNCHYWTVWAASTTASTVSIGPLMLNVPNGLSVGPTNAAVGIGSVALFDITNAIIVKVANRVFRNQVVVTALSQPTIPVGSPGSPAGNIQIQETGLGQLKAGEEICVEILPNQNAGLLYDAFMKGLNTADRPVVDATNGLVVTAVTMHTFGVGCLVPPPPPILTSLAIPSSNLVIAFSFNISQQSTTGNGKLVISNIKYATVNDAVAGPISVQVFGLGGIPTQVQFQSIISNAKIGALVAGTAATRLGVTRVGAFTTSTKVTTRGKYITYRFDFGVGAASQTFKIWGATKTGNDWSGFAVVTARVANASGVVYYYIRQNAAAWKSYRAEWTGGGVFTPARQSRWR